MRVVPISPEGKWGLVAVYPYYGGLVLFIVGFKFVFPKPSQRHCVTNHAFKNTDAIDLTKSRNIPQYIL